MSAVVKIGMESSAVTTGLNNLERRFSSFAQTTQGMFGRMAGTAGALGVSFGLAGMIRRGLEFNQTMGDSEVAIAQVLRQMANLNEEAAKQEAAKAMQQMLELEPRTAGTLSTLIDGFLATLAASQSAGLSVEQNIDLVGRFANAMANANIPAEQLASEMRMIMTGTIGADALLAKMLGITNEMITSAKSAGNLYQLLVEKIGNLGNSGDSAAVAFSSLESAIDKALGSVTQGLFDGIVARSKDLTQVIEELQPFLQDVGKELRQIGGFGINAFQGITDWAAALLAKLNGVKDVNAELQTQWRSRQSQPDGSAAGASSANPSPAAGGSGSSTAPSSSPASQARSIANDLAGIERLRAQYAEMQFEALQRSAPLEVQIANLKKLQAQRAEEFRQAMEAGPQTEQAMLTFAIADEKLQQEITSLLKQQADLKQQAADAGALEQQRLSQAKSEMQLQLDILAARASGDAERVALLEKEQRIQERMVQLKEELKLSEADALKAAKAMVELEDRAAKREQAQTSGDEGRGKIKGLNAEVHQRAMERWRMSGLDGYQAQIQGGQRLSETFTFPGLDATKRMQERGADGKRLIPVGGLFEAERREAQATSDGTLLAEIKAVLEKSNAHLEAIETA